MEPTTWEDFSTLSDYQRWVEAGGNRQNKFTFKVGVFDKNRFSFDQLGHFFHAFVPDPPADKKAGAVVSVLGIHTHNSVMLSAENFFEAPKAFVRQGDIFEHLEDAGFPVTTIYSPTHWVVLSQTCTTDHDVFCSVAPAFAEHELLPLLDLLGVKKPNPPDAVRNNRKPRLLAMPPSDLLTQDSRLIVDLGQTFTMESKKLKANAPKASLTFPGNAYLSCRMAMFLFRDVLGWDDGRLTKAFQPAPSK